MSGIATELTRAREGRSRTLVLLWLAAGIAFAGLVAVSFLQDEGVDFKPLWKAAEALLAGASPYADNARFVYTPSALPLLAPLGLLSSGSAHALFLIADAAMIVIAGLMCLRIFGVPLRSPAAPLLILALSVFAPVDTTLHLGNVNGFILAGGIGFLLAATRGHWRLGGWLLGSTLALKPILAPVLLLPLLYRQWGALVRAVAVPAALLCSALLLAPQTRDFFDARVDFYTEANAGKGLNSNVAIPGVVDNLGLPVALSPLLRVVVAAVCVYLVWVLFRRRGEDQASRLVDIFAVTMTGTVLVYTLSLNYYALYLLPLLVAAVLGRSVIRWWGLLGGVALFGSPDVYIWRELWRQDGKLALQLSTVRVTLGLLVVLAGYLAALPPGARERVLLAKALARLRRPASPASAVRGRG
jgi:arabinofuranan 3-O-arabinosyltransferase